MNVSPRAWRKPGRPNDRLVPGDKGGFDQAPSTYKDHITVSTSRRALSPFPTNSTQRD